MLADQESMSEGPRAAKNDTSIKPSSMANFTERGNAEAAAALWHPENYSKTNTELKVKNRWEKLHSKNLMKSIKRLRSKKVKDGSQNSSSSQTSSSVSKSSKVSE